MPQFAFVLPVVAASAWLVALAAPVAAADPPARPPGLSTGTALVRATPAKPPRVGRLRPDPPATGSLAGPRDAGDDPLVRLNTLLAQGRYDTLVDKWGTVAPSLRIAWAREILFDGGSVAVAAPLARDLWMAGPADGAGQDPRFEAVKVVLYAYLRLRIDGEHCKDASSPGDRILQLRAEFRPVLANAASLPQGVIRSLALEVIALESRTADRRGADPYACVRGRLGLRSGHFLDPGLVDGLVTRAREAAAAEVLALARR